MWPPCAAVAGMEKQRHSAKIAARQQLCGAWGCDKRTATYDRPLCYEHWRMWQNWTTEECGCCHWFYGPDDVIINDWSGLPERAAKLLSNKPEFLCWHCTLVTLEEMNQLSSFLRGRTAPEAELIRSELKRELAEIRPMPPPRRELRREPGYVYILKNNDGSFYVGQTRDLALRLQEHRDGKQVQSRGKSPKLVYFEQFEGEPDAVNAREGELTILTRSEAGQRQLRRLIEKFRAPIKLVDLDA